MRYLKRVNERHYSIEDKWQANFLDISLTDGGINKSVLVDTLKE